MIRRQLEPPSAFGNTGRYPDGLELPPAISPQQAAWDRRRFLQAAENARKDAARRARRKYEQRRKAA